MLSWPRRFATQTILRNAAIRGWGEERRREESDLLSSQIKTAEDFVSLPFAAEASHVPQLEADKHTTSPVCPWSLSISIPNRNQLRAMAKEIFTHLARWFYQQVAPPEASCSIGSNQLHGKPRSLQKRQGTREDLFFQFISCHETGCPIRET